MALIISAAMLVINIGKRETHMWRRIAGLSTVRGLYFHKQIAVLYSARRIPAMCLLTLIVLVCLVLQVHICTYLTFPSYILTKNIPLATIVRKGWNKMIHVNGSNSNAQCYGFNLSVTFSTSLWAYPALNLTIDLWAGSHSRNDGDFWTLRVKMCLKPPKHKQVHIFDLWSPSTHIEKMLIRKMVKPHGPCIKLIGDIPQLWPLFEKVIFEFTQ